MVAASVGRLPKRDRMVTPPPPAALLFAPVSYLADKLVVTALLPRASPACYGAAARSKPPHTTYHIRMQMHFFFTKSACVP